ncbi:hydrolase, family [Fusarium agapanthi]|uniref:Hydrolase, family n=1 Tax=Fusarium agapanthi TaxID=1803897 RepID=A0A9P5BEF9_9HYPO|nr:hydrolase, family [Fusarium agapanthi]
MPLLFRDDPYYASKEYNLEDIEVSILSVGNWGNTAVHLRGNILGYLVAGSLYKFLRLGVGRHDLPFYQDEEQPPIDMVVRKGNVGYNDPEAEKAGYTRRTENEWPLARTQYTNYYLHRNGTMSTEPEATQVEQPVGRLSYEALGTPEEPRFIEFSTPPFTKETEITGHIVAHLNVSATPHLGKRSSTRVPLETPFLSHRRHRDWLPHQDYFSTDVQPVIPGEVYAVDVEVWPTNVVVEPGSCLILEIASGDTPGVGIFVHDGAERTEERFGGMNHIHFAPHYQNYITLPIV